MSTMQATATVTCKGCWDSGACTQHKDAHVKCGRCAGTGQFITGSMNGVPTGPGGICFRCHGKGYHTPDDRRRNAYYDEHAPVRL